MAVELRAVRGATTLDEDTEDQVRERVGALVTAILARNGLGPEDLVSAIFSATEDVTAAYPATAARALPGFADVPLLGCREMAVVGAVPRCIRVLVHCYTERARGEIQHVYLEGAESLRPDLVS
ncbi:MAG: chorismate mutase [Acidimicrobiales bacterium]|jgi:chorismate mutase